MGKQLCKRERKAIERFLVQGKSKSEIARILGVSHTTIGREVNNERNWDFVRVRKCVVKMYCAEKAQNNYHQNKLRCGAKYKFTKSERGFEFVEHCVLAGMSPDNAINRAVKENIEVAFSARTFYNYVEHGISKVTPFDLRFKLRRKVAKKKIIRKHKRKMGKCIDLRPEVINTRQEFGHWEGDFIVDKNDNAILVLQERLSRFGLLVKINKREKNEVFEKVKLCKEKYNMQSLTIDNDGAFFRLLELEDNSFEIYFTHPYSSFEKGSVENFNGLIRRYIPKGQDISQLTQETLTRIQNQINTMPRKIHNYFTANEMYISLTENQPPRIIDSIKTNVVFLKQKMCI